MKKSILVFVAACGAALAVYWPLAALAGVVTFIAAGGTMSATWEIGGPTGPLLNSSSGAIEVRNAANSAYAIARGATPVGTNDLATKNYVDSVTLAGDVVGAPGSNVVDNISNAGTVNITSPTLQFRATVASPTFSQATPTSDVATQNMSFTSEAPYASATTHKVGGQFVFTEPAPVGGANSVPVVQIAQGGIGGHIYLGACPGGGNRGCIWPYETSPTNANATIGYDGATLTLNPATQDIFSFGGGQHAIMTSDGLQLGAAGTAFGGATGGILGLTTVTGAATSIPGGGVAIYANTGSVFEMAAQGLAFNQYATAPTFTIATPTSDRSVPNLTIVGGSAYATATVHTTGSNVVLTGGAGTTAANEGGAYIGTNSLNDVIDVQHNSIYLNSTGGNIALNTPVQPPSGVGTLYIGAVTTPITTKPTSGGQLEEFSTGELDHLGAGGAFDTVATSGAGTVHTQHATHVKQTNFGQVTSSGGSFSGTGVLIGAGLCISIKCEGICRTVTAGTGGGAPAVGDAYEGSSQGTWCNNSGTVTKIGATTVFTAVSSGGISSSSTGTAPVDIGGVIECQMTLVSVGGTFGTCDGTLYSEYFEN